MKLTRKLLFFPALAVGVIALVVAIKTRPDLPSKPAGDRSRVVDIMPLELKAFAPKVTGFGNVTPKLEWSAISEVSGKVIYRHPALEKGKVLAAGTEVLRIDPLDYELKLVQTQADLRSSQTSLTRIDQEEKNLKQTLKIENNRLVIANNELKRKQDLRKKGLTSQSDVDQQEQSALSQQKLVQDIENQLSLLPDERAVAQAKVKVDTAKVQEAERSLEKTRIVLPAEMRIAQVDVELDQVVNQQQAMFVAHGMDVMEVEAQLSIHDMRTLVSSLGDFAANDQGMPQADGLAINATISLNSGNLDAEWPARISRISETVDPNQATVGVILEVQQAYRELSPDSQPPLVNGMFVTANLEGQANPSWVVPERAVHGGKIYLMNDENRLDIIDIDVLYRRDNQVVIDGELEQGDKLVVNDLLPAIKGMLLREDNANDGEEAQ